MTQTTGPLAGITVFEIASFVAGPLAGMTLGQLGAEVIRIDPLGGAADRNRWPVAADGTSIYWKSLNKGKQSLEVNLRSEEGQRLVHELIGASARGTAVVLTNIGGQLWLDPDTIREACPDVIWIGIEGKSGGAPSVDYTTNAAMGFPLVTGTENMTEPVNHVLPAWDVTCGLYVALGVTAAARHREHTGEGQTIRIALDDVALATAGNLGFIAEAKFNASPRARIGNHLYGGFANNFACSDGQHIMLVALTTRHWRDLVQLTGIETAVLALQDALGADFTVEADRYEYREVLAAMIVPWFKQRTRNEVEAELTVTSCLWSSYRSFTDVANELEADPYLNPIVQTLEQPGLGTYQAPGLPLRFDANLPLEPAPEIGEHSRDILRDRLGADDETLISLRSSGAIS